MAPDFSSARIAKRSDSPYEPGKRSGLWQKYRLNLQQEFVIGGYTRGANTFDALIIGFYRGKDLIFAARVRAGFVPATRREVYEQLQRLKITKCPFANLPQKEPGRWGQGLTAEKMKQCVWLKPETVVRIDLRSGLTRITFAIQNTQGFATTRIQRRSSRKLESSSRRIGGDSAGGGQDCLFSQNAHNFGANDPAPEGQRTCLRQSALRRSLFCWRYLFAASRQ